MIKSKKPPKSEHLGEAGPRSYVRTSLSAENTGKTEGADGRAMGQTEAATERIICAVSSLALKHKALDFQVNHSLFPLPFKSNSSLRQLRFLGIAVDGDILEGTTSGVHPVAQHISDGVVLARNIHNAEIELAKCLVPLSNCNRSGIPLSVHRPHADRKI